MNVLIPMGGLGSRFRKAGYNVPKPLVRVVGRPMIFWLLDNLSLKPEDTVWFGLSKELEDPHVFQVQVAFALQKRVKVRFINLGFDTRGASETLYIMLSHMGEEDLQKKTISLDCDTFYYTDVLELFRQLPSGEAAVYYFHDEGPRPIYSYTALTDDGKATKIVEKLKISHNANTGAYAFPSAKVLLHECERIIDASVGAVGEYYTSGVLQQLIRDGKIVRGIQVDDFHCLGTPTQLEEFLRKVAEGKVKVPSRRFCFDLDNTLVTSPKVPGDYSTVDPIPDNIRIVQELHEAGHTIIIYTARRMRTHSGNVGKVIADIADVTFQTLRKFEVPYHEIYFGKPYADVYVDDLAVNALEDTARDIGWQGSKSVQAILKGVSEAKKNFLNPRKVTSIVVDKGHVLKSAPLGDIEGEIFFYTHMPDSISHFVPEYFGSTVSSDGKSAKLDIGFVNGIPFAHLLTHMALTRGRFSLLIESLKEFHEAKLRYPMKTETKSFMYNNYAQKFERRLKHWSSPLRSEQFEKCYSVGMEVLQRYENEAQGVWKEVIHGNPVFGNCLLTANNEVKFIDMRGKLGDHLSLGGDVNYDWAKVLQSLYGFDFFVRGRKPTDREQQYLENLRQQFLEEVLGMDTERFAMMKGLTAALFLSLIPLHDNVNIVQFSIEIASELLGIM